MVTKMENTRRPFDRSSEPGPKKPRLAEGLNGRPSVQRPVASGSNPLLSRFGNGHQDSRNKDSGGGGYKPMPMQQQQQRLQQQYYELVSQYKNALAELTFNSKPIITNLTIIAGENIHAAKAVVGTICDNIIEVPSEQKLPSLYLLDSIVKNIGRDYIKYFSARLPEIFCKAYGQVNPPIHSSMRHLFGTWKGVFPLHTLQMIEKELGFTSAVDVPSSGTTSRPDTQSQRPPHSIHINPKYLERQRLKQSNGAGVTANCIEDVESPGGASNVSSTRYALVEPPPKAQSDQRKEAVSERVNQENIGTQYKGYEYGSDLSKNSGFLRSSERVLQQAHDKSSYGAGRNVTEKAISGQGNRFNIDHGYASYEASKSANDAMSPNPKHSIPGRNSGGISSSWKNSEEEEFMWDDMSYRQSDHKAVDKNNWKPGESGKLVYGNYIQKPCSIGSAFMRESFTDSVEEKEQTSFGLEKLSSLKESNSNERNFPSRKYGLSNSEGYPSTLSGLRTSADSLVKMGVRPESGLPDIGGTRFGFLTNAGPEATGKAGKQQLQSLGAVSPSVKSPMRQQPRSPSFHAFHPHLLSQKLTERDHPNTQSLSRIDLKSSHFSGQPNTTPINQRLHDSSPPPPMNVHQVNTHEFQSKDMQDTSQSMPFQLRHPYTLSQNDPPGLDQKQLLPHSLIGSSAPDYLKTLDIETSGQSSTCSLSNAVMRSGALPNARATSSLPNLSHDMEKMPSKSGTQLTFPSGFPPTELLSPGSGLAATTNISPQEEQPPMSHGPAQSSVSGRVSPQTSKVASNTSNQFSDLLSSLVAKGLISESKKDPPIIISSEIPSRSLNKNQGISSTSSVFVSPVPAASVLPTSSTLDVVPPSELADRRSVPLPKSTLGGIKNFIGFQFKQDIIRQLHPSVISGISGDFPHRCIICSLQLKCQEQLDRHLEWHALKENKTRETIQVCRRWFATSDDWVTKKKGLPFVCESSRSIKESSGPMQKEVPLVPADENQCACVLCGELFEDFYCQEREEWMFTGAIFSTIPYGDYRVGTRHGDMMQHLIVHANCIRKFSS